MNIAIIGSGISGLAAAWLLQQKHRVTLFEAAGYLGGHTNTVDVTLDNTTHPVDTGFLVHNELTYPNLIQLFNHLGIETHSTEMSLSVSLPQERIEWSGSSLANLFGQKKNLVRPGFWLMLRDILRFNEKSQDLLDWSLEHESTLGVLLDQHRYSRPFREWYLLPMAASIWSAPPDDILNFPAATFLRFCMNHRLLQFKGRPDWRSVLNGARTYVARMSKNLDVRLESPVDEVVRTDTGVEIASCGKYETYESVVFATHAPDTLSMLQDADSGEREVLGAIAYQTNTAVLHTDQRYLPQRTSLWSAWNYRAADEQNNAVSVTYLLNRLQRLPFQTPLLLTLNPPADTAPRNEIARFEYAHPVFNQAAINAQAKLPTLQGVNKAWFCGAWCGYGFHEDGLKSALRVANDFSVEAPWPVKF